MPLLTKNYGKSGFVVFWVAFYAIAILQDLLYSILHHTAFYWTESSMYNTFWLLFIPATTWLNQLPCRYTGSSSFFFTGKHLLTSLILTPVHILVFTSLFIFQSTILYDNPHRFENILYSVLTHHTGIALMIYAFSPLIFRRWLSSSGTRGTAVKAAFQDHLMIKQGRTSTRIVVSAIVSIRADKPYCVLCCENRKLLHNSSLKELSQVLDPSVFIRVHRSSIVNINFIRKVESRGNGDYDAILSDGSKVRLSRHFRQNWDRLVLHPGSNVLPLD